MKKKLMCIFLIAILVVSALAMFACNKSKYSAEFNVPEGGYDGSAVTIKFYHTMGANLREVLEE